MKFCVVGFGDHAEKKILPALKNINASVLGIVSSKNQKLLPFNCFNSIDDALKKLDRDCVFILCSPPHAHFEQSEKIINAGFNLFIEKPIALSIDEITSLIKLSEKKKIFFVENFMHTYCSFYENFIDFYEKKNELINIIDIRFMIPSLVTNSFRNLDNLKYSINIYDVGCYIVSLLNDLSENVEINISKISNRNMILKEKIFARSMINELTVNIKFGFGEQYQNSVNVKLRDGSSYIFEPFFYGRKGNRKVHINTVKRSVIKNYFENDCFQNIFKKDKSYWLDTQNSRNDKMIKNISLLENLSKQYNDIN